LKKIEREEILSALQRRANLQAYNLKRADFSRLNLSNHDLSSLDLSGAKFKQSNLEKANLSKSILNGSSFLKANLKEANMSETHCSRTDFTKADLSGTDLTHAILQDIVVYKTKMKSVNLDMAQLEGVDLSSMDLTECEARNANFRKTNLGFSCLNGANLRAANFEEANLSDIKAKSAFFSGSCLVRTNLEGAVLDGTDFSQADMTKANLSLTSLERINLESTKLVETNFRLSRGIAEGKKEYLRQQGAKVTFIWEKTKKTTKFVLKTPWVLATLGIFLVAAIMGVYFYFTNINHFSISSLTKELINAKQSKQYEKALQINQILIRKLDRKGNHMGVFSRSLDVARMYRLLGNRKMSVELLEAMFENYHEDNKKIAQIKLELALNYKDSGNFGKAITLMEDIETSNLTNSLIHSLEINLAKAYWEEKNYQQAVASYKKIAEEFSTDPKRYSNALKNLAQVYIEMGEIEESSEIWANILWNPKEPKPYFRKQMNIALKLSEEGRHSEALTVYDNLLIKIKENPVLVNKVKNKINMAKKKR